MIISLLAAPSIACILHYILHAYFITLQQIDSDEMLKCIKELIKLEKEWVPDSNTKKTRGSSLYIRPTMIGTNVCNGS